MSTEREKGVALITSLLVLILISAIIVGMSWMVMTDKRLGGNNQSRELAFYGAEAGMEKITTDVANTYSTAGALTAANIATITAAPPTAIPGITHAEIRRAFDVSDYADRSGIQQRDDSAAQPLRGYAGFDHAFYTDGGRAERRDGRGSEADQASAGCVYSRIFSLNFLFGLGFVVLHRPFVWFWRTYAHQREPVARSE